MQMPLLDRETIAKGLNDTEAEMVLVCLNKRTGRLRASKPFRKVSSIFEASANYVWRMLCFDLAGFGPHICMPCTADFDLYAVYQQTHSQLSLSERARLVGALTNNLDDLVTKAETNIPCEQKRGLHRWGRVFGI